MSVDALEAVVINDAIDVSGIVARRTQGPDRVSYKVLWEREESHAALLCLEAGAALASHSHEHGHHHVWIVTGACEMFGRILEAGSYCHIPAGIEHRVRNIGVEPCKLFYMYESTVAKDER